MTAFRDDLRLGAAQIPNSFEAGLGPLGRVFIYDIVPVTLDADGICAAQGITGASNALINGALASGGTATLDVPRALQMVSANAGDTTQTVTIYGTDFYGQAQTEARSLNGTSVVNLTKAFKTVTRVAVSATTAGNITVGTRDAFGLPVRTTNVAYVVSVKWNSTLAQDAGTFAAADVTSPATSTTNDVRGTYIPANAADSSKRLVMCIATPAIAAGPDATTAGAIGVTPA
jgi:hypothetical protein